MRTGAPLYKVINPNGGESFIVGDTLRVVIAGADAPATALEIWRFRESGNFDARLPGVPSRSFDAGVKCEFRFAIPESLYSNFGDAFSLDTDSLRIRVADYNNGAIQDFSDGFFRIRKD